MKSLRFLDMKRNGKLCRGKGCKYCFESGYKGRRGIYELLTIDSRFQSKIARKADALELRTLAKEQGMLTLRDHGIHLIKTGITTIAEVLRFNQEILICRNFVMSLLI